MPNLMQIGEVAERAAIGPQTIRLYEKRGLIAPAERKGMGYRHYDETALKRLEKVTALKRIGLSLDEIASVIDLYFEDATGITGKERVLEILQAHHATAITQISELTAFKHDLEANIARMQILIAQAQSQ